MCAACGTLDTLVVATSMPLRLVREWLRRWGEEKATQLCLQSITSHQRRSRSSRRSSRTSWHAHCCTRNRSCRGLAGALRGDGRLSCSTSEPPCAGCGVAAVQSTSDLQPKSILDYCAGQGTKTRQLAARRGKDHRHRHPPGPTQRSETATESLANVNVVGPDDVGKQQYDLILLDIPCSNTGVWPVGPKPATAIPSRRWASWSNSGEIIDQAKSGCCPMGCCSIPPALSNRRRTRIRRSGWSRSAELLYEHQQFPTAGVSTYTDGSYHALLKL